MKTIGIIARRFDFKYDDRTLEIMGIVKHLSDNLLKKYEDIRVILIPLENKKEIFDICDGVIFPGGLHVREEDIECMKYLHKIDKPTLGLCLGIQIMGETFNGKTRENFVEENHNIMNEYVHNVEIDTNSKLYEILGKTKIRVNSRHKHALESTDLKISARSEDGIIEAIEDSSKKFFIGVQWHPETIIEDEYSTKLFDYFISKC